MENPPEHFAAVDVKIANAVKKGRKRGFRLAGILCALFHDHAEHSQENIDRGQQRRLSGFPPGLYPGNGPRSLRGSHGPRGDRNGLQHPSAADHDGRALGWNDWR